MELFLFRISVFCFLSLNFVSLPGAKAQCLSPNDDLSQPGSTDLSGILDFSLRLFQELAPKDEKTNFIFSPYSIWNALVLGYYGSGGQTEVQYRKVLGLGDKISTMRTWRALEHLYITRPQTSVNNTFILANTAYFDKNIRLRSCMEEILHGEMKKIDFGQPIKAADTINQFVSETTRGNIDNLLTPEDVKNAIVALVNAAYFKGSWEKVFDKKYTRKSDFFGFDNVKYSVDMMDQIGSFKLGYDEKLQTEVAELPYDGKTISMLIFLPSKNTIANFNNLLQGLSVSYLEDVLSQMSPKRMILRIPKFSLKFTCKDELITGLKKMGLTDPFDPSKANFSAFTTNKQQFSLDKSFHQAFINVNEEGTEAGAATAFAGTKSSIPSFVCNRPFVFAIRDAETRNLMFMGVYKSSDSYIGSPDQSGIPNSGVGTDPIIDQNKDSVLPINWDNESQGPIVPPTNRNKENIPIRNTIRRKNSPEQENAYNLITGLKSPKPQ